MTDKQKLEEALLLALDIPERDVGAWLVEYCQNDNELKGEIESLLSHRTKASNFLEISAAGYALKLMDVEAGRSVEKQFGSYKTIREIGRGGMGAVYLAERSDEAFDRQVALKIISRSFIDPDLERYFRRERQILAQLDHPNIAKLFDGGVSENGEPYLVMEFVNGENLIDYARSRGLDLNSRLELFLKVCDAVSYAHRNLIVHRDIKPTNILVNTEGEPKLLDFGLAKAVSATLDDEDSTQTEFRALTPAYASPEQLSRRPVTTASDIYSLGKVLEKLLYSSDDDVANTAPCNKEINNILKMAMREEPERRYVSVDVFAADLNNYLNSRPITARPATIRYRLSKFVNRNKITVGAGALGVAAALAGLILALWQGNVARAQRDIAQHEKLKAERTSEFLATALQIADPTAAIPGSTNRRDATIQQMLDDVAPRVDVEFADQPEILASLQRTIGLAYSAQARIPEAERYLNASLDSYMRVYGEERQETASVYVALASVHEAKGDVAGAADLLQKAVAVYRSHPPVQDLHRRIFAGALTSTGDVNWTLGDFNSADANYTESLALAQSIQTGDNRELVANAKRGLGITRYAQGRLDEAAGLLREAINEYRQQPQLRWKLPDALNFLAQTLIWKNEYGSKDDLRDALAHLQESETIALDVWGENNFWYPRSLWLQAYARCFIGKPECAAAEPDLNKAESINNRLYPDNNITKANIFDARTIILLSKGRLSDAEAVGRRSVEMYLTAMKPGAPSVTLARIHLADCLVAQKRYDDAQIVLNEAYKDSSEMQGLDHWRTKEAGRRLATLEGIRQNTKRF